MRTAVLCLTAAVCVGGARPAASLLGSALQLDGHGAYVEVPPSSGLHADRALTVTGWFRADGALAARGWQALFWKGDTPDHSPYANREYGLWLSGSGHLTLASTPADSAVRQAVLLNADQVRVQPGRWYHFAAVISADDEGIALYLDGRRVAEATYHPSGLRATSGPLRLGGIPERDHFLGLLDEVRIWGRALNAAEIVLDLHTPLQPAADPQAGADLRPGAEGLLAAYTFDALGADQQLPDVSGHGHHGRLAGGARLAAVRVLTPPAAAVADSAALRVVTSPAPTLRPIRGELADVLIEALSSDDYHVRTRAALSFDQVALEDLPRVLRHGLQSDHFEVRTRAADALADLESLAQGTATAEEMIVHSPPVAVVDLAASTPAPGSRPQHPDGNAYRGWEERWQAPRPEDWHLEPEGLVVRYNRVEGIYAGWQLPRSYRSGESLTHYGSVGYGLAGEALRYQAGGEVYTFYSPSWQSDNLAAVGAELHDLTDTQDSWLLPEEENSVDAVLFRRDFRDYYRRQGWSAYTAHNVGGVLQLTGRYQWDEFRSLGERVDWGLFGDRLGRSAFRPNPAIDAGQVRSLRADVQLDTRDRRDGPARGWLANALFERAGGVLGGDARFKRYLADVRRYQPIGRGARADLRLRLGTAKGRLPQEYLYDLGGYGSLRGYPFKAFTGDRMVLVNAEYWIDADREWHTDLPADDLHLGAFLDTGAAWTAADAHDPFDGTGPLLGTPAGPGDPDWHTSLGLALGFDESLRIYAAHPLSGPEDWVLSLRVSRSF